MTKIQSESLDLESKFWEIKKRVRPEDDLKPTNLNEERNVFFQERKLGRVYDPLFKYRSPVGSDKIDVLQNIVMQAERLSNIPPFVSLAKELMAWIENFEQRGDYFGEWLYSIFGCPDATLVSSARKTLEQVAVEEQETKKVGSTEAKKYFEKILREYKLANWKVVVSDMASKAAVNSEETTLFINRLSEFSQGELDRLSVHEIGTHVVRHENGKKVSSQVFRYGFPGYIECEEGLAIVSEERAGLLTNNDLRKYCLRVLACDLARYSTFTEVFENLQVHTTVDSAFDITARVKRGLVDTSSSLGYSKDQVYFSGYKKVKSIDISDIHKLFIGKIGFTELEGIDFSSIDTSNIFIPEWWNNNHGQAQ